MKSAPGWKAQAARAPSAGPFLATLSWLFLLAVSLRGGEGGQLYTEDSTNSESGKAITCVWLVRGCRFQFAPPPGWSVQGNPTNATLQLTEPDLRAAIGFTLHAQAETNAPAELEAWRERVKERYPKAVWLRDSPSFIAEREGWGCDLALPVDKGIETRIRVVSVPYPGGIAEFEMRTSVVHDSLARRAMRRVVNSLRIELTRSDDTPRR